MLWLLNPWTYVSCVHHRSKAMGNPILVYKRLNQKFFHISLTAFPLEGPTNMAVSSELNMRDGVSVIFNTVSAFSSKSYNWNMRNELEVAITQDFSRIHGFLELRICLIINADNQAYHSWNENIFVGV